MKQSHLFTKTRKEAPKDEVSLNAQLLIRAGFINKELAGAYAFLPLGLRVMKKIEQIVREEMDAIGGQEIEMTTLQGKEIWEKAGKWDERVVDVWFKTLLKNGTELGLAFSHEEPISMMLMQHMNSYKDLPQYIYQFQTKFRNELRSKSGIMRGREFLMKDMYSYNTSKEDLYKFYDKAKVAYKNVFDRLGIGDITFITVADGSVFGDSSHEFQTLSDVGEDTIYLDREKMIAINDEVYSDEKVKELGLKKENLEKVKSIEVANIFPIEKKVSDALGLSYIDEKGTKQPIWMGSYGIGISRAMGTVVEVKNDEKGIIWPESIAPFMVHLIELSNGNEEVTKKAEEVYKWLTEQGVEVLWDNREIGAGVKFADSDLIGIPHRVVVSAKNEDKLEYKKRSETESQFVSLDELLQKLKK